MHLQMLTALTSVSCPHIIPPLSFAAMLQQRKQKTVSRNDQFDSVSSFFNMVKKKRDGFFFTGLKKRRVEIKDSMEQCMLGDEVYFQSF